MRWIEVTVRVSPSRLDLAGDLLLQAIPRGFVEFTDGPGSSRRLQAYLSADAAGRSVLSALRRSLRRAGARVEACVRSDTSWTRAFQARGRRVRVGRLVIQPPWMVPPADRRAVVRVSPGMAFGSGEHESTQLCLRAISRHVRAGATVIDLGTGSGILAIAAAKLGAARVLAIDNDPAAVSVARANVRANHVERFVTVRLGEGVARVRLRANLLVANLTADALPAILPDVPRCLAPGGRFVASGFTAARVPEVRRHLAAVGLAAAAVDRQKAWRAVHAVASGGTAARAAASSVVAERVGRRQARPA